jgi:putative ABC transport system substrate-binding protein
LFLAAAGCGLERLSTSRPMMQRRLAYLSNNQPTEAGTSALMDAFRDAMMDFGYTDRQNLLIEERYASGDEQAAAFGEVIARIRPEVILVPSATVALAVTAISPTLPVVNAGQGDLVTSGLAESVARPGGTVTGISSSLPAGKALQLLQETVPSIRTVGVLVDATFVAPPREAYQQAAADLGLELLFLPISGPTDFESAIGVARHQSDALYVLAGPTAGTTSSQARLGELAIRARLPTMWQCAAGASHAGGLMSYGPNREAMYRRAAWYVDRLFRGANPAALPIEQPSVFDFTVNLSTARALGLDIPQTILAQATEVMQ